jgi:hypothetical protein
MSDRERRVIIRRGDRFTQRELDDGAAELEQVEPVPEPPDIGQRSREHDEAWRDHFGERM